MKIDEMLELLGIKLYWHQKLYLLVYSKITDILGEIMTQLNNILGKYGFHIHHGVTSYNDTLDFIAKIWEVISDEEKDEITDILVGQNHPVLHEESRDEVVGLEENNACE